jgi:hypothetical protein
VTFIVFAVLCVVAVAAYFLFRGNKNQFPIDIGNMTPRDRADVLVNATIWRLRWETDNPQFPGIFLSPNSFSPEVCNQLFHVLLNTVVQLSESHQALVRQLTERGVTEKLSDADINGCRVWMGTIGTRSGRIKRDDMMLVWACMREAIPFVDESMEALMKKQETHRRLGQTTDLLLGQDPRQVVKEARRFPTI